MGGCLSSVKKKADPIIANSTPLVTDKWTINKTQLFNIVKYPADSVSLPSQSKAWKIDDKLVNLFTMDQKICGNTNLDVSHALLADSDSKENCYLDLPVRKTNNFHHPKKFLSCVPLSGITRSLSLPRRPHSPPKCLDNDDKLIRSDIPSKWMIPNAVGNWVDDLEVKHFPRETLANSDRGSSPFKQSEDEKLLGVSDAASAMTVLTDDALSSNTFRDPILAELEANLPAPPPPPRACPPWLKSALKEKCSMKHPTTLNLTVPGMDYAVSSLPSPVPQSFSTLPSPVQEGLDAHKSLSLENNRFSVRIYPVLQNGVKISDTHYWLLDPPRPKNCSYLSGLGRRATERYRVPPPSPSSFSDLEQGYLNVDATDFCPSGEKPLKDIRLRRGKSEICRDSLKHFYRQLVQRLMKEVPMATEYECEAVLIGSSYNYDQAVKRLKLELLCRNAHTSQPYGKRLLLKHNWDLDEAIHQARLEYEKKKAKSRQKHSGIPYPSFPDRSDLDSSDHYQNPESLAFPRNFASSESSVYPQSVHGLPESPSWFPNTPSEEDLAFPTVYAPPPPISPTHHEHD